MMEAANLYMMKESGRITAEHHKKAHELEKKKEDRTWSMSSNSSIS
jgi:hypothetical protein